MTAVADTTGKILDAASQLFAERGYAATTTRAIAERAGVNEVTIFRRFENKAGVLRALGERFAEQSMARSVPELPDPDDVEATLLAIGRSEVSASIENGGVALRLAFDASTVPEVAELVGTGPRSNLETLAQYLADRQKAGQLRTDIPPMVMAEAFGALTSSFVMFRTIMGVLDTPDDPMADTSVEQLVDLFFNGVAAR